MLRLDKVVKPWKETAALCDHIKLYGFWNETAFLTKSGDLGMVLSVAGVDYESLDHAEQEYAVKRLEAALKVPDEPELRRQEREPKGVLQKNLKPLLSISVRHCW
jgi:hypothetical protein